MHGNQRHGPYHDAATFGSHPYGRKPPPSRGARVRSAKSGCEPLRHDRPLRQPTEPLPLLLLRARPRRFPGHDGTAVRAVDYQHRRLYLGGCAAARTAAAQAIRATLPCRCRSPTPPCRLRLLFALTLLAVFRIVPVAAAVATVAAAARRPRPARLGRRGLGPARHLRLLLRVRGQPGARAGGVRMALAPHGRSRPARERPA